MGDTVITILIIILEAVVLILQMLLMGYIAASIIYKKVLTREHGKNGKWSRVCSEKGNPEQELMWNTGLAWWKKYEKNHQEITVASDGFSIVGDYFDFGFKRCVIIAPGRNETGIYSAYFAEPYRKGGCNVLVFDPRAHGKSTGEYSYCGIGEADDALSLATYAHDVLKNEEIFFHGICIGGGSMAILMGSDRAPSFVKGICLDGLYTTFYEQFKNHLIEGGHPSWPIMMMIRLRAKKTAGVDILKQGPLFAAPNIQVPVLMLSGKQDTYSLPEKSEEIFSKIGSNNKKIVWFPIGRHSHLKINDEKGYEKTIVDWLKTV